MQKYKLLKQGKDCALYRLCYTNPVRYKFLVKDKEGDLIAMCVTATCNAPDDFVELVDTYDLDKIHAEKRAEHDKWVKEFVE